MAFVDCGLLFVAVCRCCVFVFCCSLLLVLVVVCLLLFVVVVSDLAVYRFLLLGGCRFAVHCCCSLHVAVVRGVRLCVVARWLLFAVRGCC